MIHWTFFAVSGETAFRGQSTTDDSTADDQIDTATNDALRLCKRMAQLTGSPWDQDNVSITITKDES